MNVTKYSNLKLFSFFTVGEDIFKISSRRSHQNSESAVSLDFSILNASEDEINKLAPHFESDHITYFKNKKKVEEAFLFFNRIKADEKLQLQKRNDEAKKKISRNLMWPRINLTKNSDRESPEVGASLPQQPHSISQADTVRKQIDDIDKVVEDLISAVEKFNGNQKNREFLILDENLTQKLIELDNLTLNNESELKLKRKSVIKKINQTMEVLESKLVEPGEATEANPDEFNEEKPLIGFSDSPPASRDLKKPTEKTYSQVVAEPEMMEVENENVFPQFNSPTKREKKEEKELRISSSQPNAPSYAEVARSNSH